MTNITETRKLFKEELDLLSSKLAQQKYQTEVPIANVPAELLCGWFDDLYHPEAEWFHKAFSPEEQKHLKEFNDYYEIRSRELPTMLPDLLENPVWEEIVKKAKETIEKIKW